MYMLLSPLLKCFIILLEKNEMGGFLCLSPTCPLRISRGFRTENCPPLSTNIGGCKYELRKVEDLQNFDFLCHFLDQANFPTLQNMFREIKFQM